MITGKEFVKAFSEVEEEEKLFSTGNEELDILLEKIYSEGIEDGYTYAQKEFNAHKRNQRQAIMKGEQAAQAQASKANKAIERYQKDLEIINKHFGGDLEKALEGNGRLKGMYLSGPHREAMENLLAGQKAAEQATVTKHVESAAIQAERTADQVHKLGKTRQSVRSNEGNTFRAGGRDVKVQEGALGDARVNTSNYNNGDKKRQTEVLSKTNERRQKQVERSDRKPTRQSQPQTKNQPQANTKPKTPVIDRKNTPNNATQITSQSANRAHEVIIEPNKTPIINNTPTTKPAPTTSEIIAETTQKGSSAAKKNNWFTKFKGNKPAKIAAGVIAGTGLAYGAYKLGEKRKEKNIA